MTRTNYSDEDPTLTSLSLDSFSLPHKAAAVGRAEFNEFHGVSPVSLGETSVSTNPITLIRPLVATVCSKAKDRRDINPPPLPEQSQSDPRRFKRNYTCRGLGREKTPQ